MRSRTSGVGVDTTELRAIVEGCRHDLDSVAQDGSHSAMEEAVDIAGMLERRFGEIANRLEGAVNVLDRVAQGAFAGGGGWDGDGDLLAREADHRIKNGLQIVMMLLQQQAMRLESDEAWEALQVASARVAAVAQVHAALDASVHDRRGPAMLEVQTYLNGLCDALAQVCGVDGARRSLLVHIAPKEITPAIAQSLGLMVSELVTNAFRHAFDAERRGTVRVVGTDLGDGRYVLWVSDDGRGLPNGFDLRQRSPGLGLRLINRLAEQLRATVTVINRGGARFSIEFSTSPAVH